jgi:hypothetical protein
MGVITTASAIALGGLAVSAGTAGMSFAQAGKQKGLQRQAERDAQNAFDEARKDLGKNYYQAIGIQKEPYELSREGLLSSSFGLTQAAQESERGAAEAAGRIYLASQQGQGQIRTAQGQELLDLEKLTAQENSRLRDIGVGLDLEQAAGYQQAAADAQEAAAKATAQGMSSATDAIKTGISEGVPLYFKQKGIDPLTGLKIPTTETAKTDNTATPATNEIKMTRSQRKNLNKFNSLLDQQNASKSALANSPSNFVMQSSQTPRPLFEFDFLNYNPPINMMNYPPQQ